MKDNEIELLWKERMSLAKEDQGPSQTELLIRHIVHERAQRYYKDEAHPAFLNTGMSVDYARRDFAIPYEEWRGK